MSSTRSKNSRAVLRASTSRSGRAATAKSSRAGERNRAIVRVQRGGENVFDDLGFDPVESANLRLRSDLIVALRKRLDALRVTQVEAARLLAVSQPRISDLMRGKIDRFSIDMLVLMLGKAGVAVRLAFSST